MFVLNATQRRAPSNGRHKARVVHFIYIPEYIINLSCDLRVLLYFVKVCVEETAICKTFEIHRSWGHKSCRRRAC